MSSLGSIISLASVLGFIVILWEAFAAGRSILLTDGLGSSLEWLHHTPPADHRYDETPLISNF